MTFIYNNAIYLVGRVSISGQPLNFQYYAPQLYTIIGSVFLEAEKSDCVTKDTFLTDLRIKIPEDDFRMGVWPQMRVIF